MLNSFSGAILREERLVIGAVLASDLCQRTQEIHKLGVTSTIALGRLMIAAVLTAFMHRRSGSLSLQVLAQGRLKQVFADVNSTGDVRGYVRPPDIAMPVLTGGETSGRRTIAHAVGEGIVSMIRTPEDEHSSQSSTGLVSGEIDTDVAHFLDASDQIPTVLSADVLLDAQDRVVRAGGLMAQAMPDGDLNRLSAIRGEMSRGAFVAGLEDLKGGSRDLLVQLFPHADVVEPGIEVRWKCRCTQQRVLSALAVLDARELAEMATQSEPSVLDCEFCGTRYTVTSRDIRKVFDSLVKARG